MNPGIPLAAAQYLNEHTGALIELLEQRANLDHGLQLAGMLKQLIGQTTSTITEKQIEAILVLTRQTHESLNNNLNHYMGQREKFSTQYFTVTDPLHREEMSSHLSNIDDQMKAIRRDMETLHRFASQVITICGDAGLRFVASSTAPFTKPQRLDS